MGERERARNRLLAYYDMLMKQERTLPAGHKVWLHAPYFDNSQLFLADFSLAIEALSIIATVKTTREEEAGGDG